MKFGKIAILGTGLLGASFAYAAKNCGLCEKISAWSRSESTRDKCAKLTNIFDEVYSTPQEAVKDADLTLICTPTANIPELATMVAPHLKKCSLVTDVGSVKGKICPICSEVVRIAGAHFVGSHPMAGSEKIGIDFADVKLFDFRPCFVTPLSEQEECAATAISNAWRALGMRVYIVTPALHDAIVARVSHLPHLAATLICDTAADFDINLLPYSGPGFKDTTRVASGSPQIWESIIVDNSAEILSTLKEYSVRLNALISEIESGEVKKIAACLKKAKTFRDKL